VGAFERQVTLFPFTGFFQPVDNPGPNDDTALSEIAFEWGP